MSILDRFTVTDHVAIVTGAGRGIGAACAVGLAEAGADVVLSARNPEQLEAVAEQIRAVGRRALVVPLDLSDPEVVATLAERAMEEFGRIDTVVNNVGGAAPKEFMGTSVKRLEGVFRFNVSTAHALTRAAVPHMLADTDETHQKSVVSISSVIARAADRGYLAYGTAKAGLSHWTRLAARDLSPRIRVNGIHTGAVMTSAMDFMEHAPDLMGQLTDRTPLRRPGQPEEIAAGVLFLASPAGSYITGKLIEIDGGVQESNLSLGLPDLV